MAFLTFISLIIAGLAYAGAYFGIVSGELGAMILGGAGVAILFLFLITALKVIFGKRASLFIFLIGLVVAAAFGYGYFLNNLFPVSDVTTDLNNPPKFKFPVFPFVVDKGAEYLDSSLQIERGYDQSISSMQYKMAPSLENIRTKLPPSDAYSASINTIKSQLPFWTILLDDPKKRHAEMTFTQGIFNLRRDVIIEVRQDPKAPERIEVALRCRSRLWFADFGACLAIVKDLDTRFHLAFKPLEDRPTPPELIIPLKILTPSPKKETKK
jgi:hypothetical protein